MTQLDLPTAASGAGEAMCTETPHQNKTNLFRGNMSDDPGFSSATRGSGRTPMSMEKETHSPEMSFFGMKASCELPR